MATILIVSAALLATLACAPKAVGPSKSSVELVVAYDDSHPAGTVVLPTGSYESVVRFDLPPGPHRLLRLRAQAAAPGKLQYTLYETTALEAPGQVLHSLTRDISPSDVSDGKDGRWLVDELDIDLKPQAGVLWLGVRKIGGDATLWASAAASDHAFMRNTDPKNVLGLMPVKRTPMLRLELAP
jgi:hypothetical protein